MEYTPFIIKCYYEIFTKEGAFSMSYEKTKQALDAHKVQALSDLSSYLSKLIDSDDADLKGKADKLSYWITDWVKFLDYEPNFDAKNLRRYKRGEIIKVHLGFNIGSEEGGLHYAVVLDKENPKSSPVVTVVPLTSVKPKTDINRLRNGSIFLGNELFTNLNAKVATTSKHLAEEIDLLNDMLESINNGSASSERKLEFTEKLNKCSDELAFLDRMRGEIQKNEKRQYRISESNYNY